MSNITYHYYSHSGFKNNCIYEVEHLEDLEVKSNEYISYYKDLDPLKIKLSSDQYLEYESLPSIEQKVQYMFKVRYDRSFKDILGRDYFGIFGIYTAPVDLFNGVAFNLKKRIKINLDTIDPNLIIIREGQGGPCHKYTKENWDLFCKPYIDNKDFLIEAYRTSGRKFKNIPNIIIFLPKIEFDESDIETDTTGAIS